MWPFFKKKKMQSPASNTSAASPIEDKPSRRPPMRFAELVNGMGGFDDFRNHDATLKFWLPEAANEALEEMAHRSNLSMSELLRQLFITHCYGVYAYQVLVDSNPEIIREPGPVLYSRASTHPEGKKRIDTYWVPELGKNVMPIKVWIPKRMRDHLQMLADHVGIKLSQYIREIVIARLLGHGTLPMRPEMLKAEPLQAIDDWCDDKDIEFRPATIDEYMQHPLGKMETEWVAE